METLLIVGLILTIIGCFRIARITFHYNVEVMFYSLGGFFIVVLLFTMINVLALLPEQREVIARFPQIQEQLDEARENNNPIELAAIHQVVLEYNDQIIQHKYWNNRNWYYDMWHVDEWDNVELIK